MSVTKEAVLDSLRGVNDPEIPVNIVDLGLIYGVEVNEDDTVHVTMTLTTKGCGMSHQIAMSAKQAAASTEGVKEAKVTVVWDPPWDQSKMSDAAKRTLGAA